MSLRPISIRVTCREVYESREPAETFLLRVLTSAGFRFTEVQGQPELVAPFQIEEEPLGTAQWFRQWLPEGDA